MDDVTLAKRVRERGIDVLIELGGYGDSARMPACAHRLAPVQIKWVGMQNHSTGLPEIEWLITDAVETPPELAAPVFRATAAAAGRLCVLQSVVLCAGCRAAAGAGERAHHLRLLQQPGEGHAAGDCYLGGSAASRAGVAAGAEDAPVRRSADGGDRLRAAFAARGIGPEQVELRGSSPHRAFMGEYGQIDIVLDPFPYSGGLTTCEALWMGVPTVTLPGEIFASRHSMSHLSNVGLVDWVARGRRGLRRAGGGEGGECRRPGGAAGGAACAGEGEPAVRRAALRPQPGRGAAARLAGMV